MKISELKKIVEGTAIALEVTKAGEPSVYDMDLNEVITINEAIELCNQRKLKDPDSDCTVIPGLRLSGSQRQINLDEPLVNLMRIYNVGIGPFLILNADTFVKILVQLDPDDIIALCNTNMLLTEKCQKTNIYGLLIQKFFKGAEKSNKYESSKSQFEKLWRTRVLLEDFQALTWDDFDLHPNDVNTIFDEYVKAVATVKEYEGWDVIELTARSAGIQMIQLLQYPRWQILENSDFDPNIARFYANVFAAENTNIILSEIFEETDNLVHIPHLDKNVSHEDYLRLLRPITPINNLRKKQWLEEMNQNILAEIDRLTSKMDKKSREKDLNDIEMLKKLLAIQIVDPSYFWTFNPTMDKLQAEYIGPVWDMLLEWRSENASNKQLTEMYFKWDQVLSQYEDEEAEDWYNADFNVVYTDGEFQDLLEKEIFTEDDYDVEDRVFGDMQRWVDYWRPGLIGIKEDLEGE